MPGSGYDSPEWKEKRLRVLERDGYRCVMCGAFSGMGCTLDVHHTRYPRGAPVWTINENYLVTLCSPCHGDVTKFVDQEREFVSGLSKSDFGHYWYSHYMYRVQFFDEKPQDENGRRVREFQDKVEQRKRAEWNIEPGFSRSKGFENRYMGETDEEFEMRLRRCQL